MELSWLTLPEAPKVIYQRSCASFFPYGSSFSSGLPHHSTIDIWDWVIICHMELGCVFQDIQQHPFPLCSCDNENVSRHCLLSPSGQKVGRQNHPSIRSPALAGHPCACGDTAFSSLPADMWSCATHLVSGSPISSVSKPESSHFLTPPMRHAGLSHLMVAHQIIATRIIMVFYLVPWLPDPPFQQ